MAADPGTDEVRALAGLAFGEARRLPDAIRDVHRAISDRAFRMAGPGAAPAALVHNVIADGVYGAVSGATGLLGRVADVALAARGPQAEAQVSATPRGALLLSILNGLQGDHLRVSGNVLQTRMALIRDGRPVEPTGEGLAAAFPGATGSLVIFLHGLMENERSWARGSEPYGVRLDRELGTTSLYVRYNSGLHVSENGAELAALLRRVVIAWPVEVQRIALIGHSMGGLVARSACFLADEAGDDWVRRVTHIVSLGTPHLGAPLEQTVHYASAALDLVPETRPLAAFLRRRSAGIRDLRQGSLADEDWRDRDPDALRAAAVREVPPLPGATHCFVSATVTRSPRHPIGRMVGDLLVLEPSATGRGRRRRLAFDPAHGLHVGGTTHLALLNHPDVYRQLKTWLRTFGTEREGSLPSRHQPRARRGPACGHGGFRSSLG